MDLSSVILSVMPLQYFKMYLKDNNPEALDYLKIVILFQPLQELNEKFMELEE